ncbi:MAG: hypothetical protein US49_C0002G0154 [candidate division TM6 bacterium GW2011_GWF2_37_49]|nr:MAG: hypothetical protein US49_C0002G0154 [candidate division TM6 bacterium GW2011_GWF2_37_49]
MKQFIKLIKPLIFVSLLYCFAFTMSDVEHTAIADLYGNKYANLALLEQNIARDVAIQTGLKTLGGFNVAVPEFVGLSHQQSIDFLKEQGFDVIAEWTKMATNNPSDSFLIESSQKISEHILKLKTESQDTADSTSDALFRNVPQVKGFVEAAKDFKAMVRSTGKEDTKKVTNAGGNESYANVPVNYKSLNEYVNAVIASYFSKKSMEQRLVEKDETIKFLPSMPVLIQRMVGEQEGGTTDITKIPVGCVVYTQETYANTQGTTIIQASWGHNAGVVDNLVSVDTFVVDKNFNVNSLIRKKSSRLIPVNENGQNSLKMVNNPAEIQNVPALSADAVKAIKVIADAIQKFYNNEPTDIELVYMPQLKTVYLVQARPLRSTSTFNPSYIKSIDGIAQEKIIKTQTILPADCACRKITNKNQVLIAPSLNDALETFIAPSFNKDQILAVVVKGNAETTSHAAAIFRGADKPVFQTQDIEKFSSWIEKEGSVVTIDAQRELISCADSTEIVTGWFTHPMPKKVSIMPTSLVVQTQIASDALPDKNLQELAAMLKSASQQDAESALNSILFKIQSALAAIREDGTKTYRKQSSQIFGQKMENLFNFVCEKSDQIKTAFNRPAFDLERLLGVNTIEAALFQAEDERFVEVYSFESIQASYKKEINFIEEKLVKMLGSDATMILQDRPLFLVTQHGFDVALTPETEKMWLNFVSSVAKSDVEAKGQFTKLVDTLNNFNAMSSWINISFASSFGQCKILKKYMQSIFVELEKSKTLLAKVQNIAEQLKNFDLNVWAEPAKFESTMQRFKKDCFEYFTSEEFKSQFKDSSSFIKLILLSFMDKFIDLFDQSIKTLKGSTKYASDADKVKNFKTMLQANFDLLNCWVHMLPADAFKYHWSWPLDTYISKIQEILNGLGNDSTQLMPTKDFSVANACLGSTTAFERNYPQTMEDTFTLLHQNLLVTLSAHLRLSMPKTWSKPAMFAGVERVLCNSTNILHPATLGKFGRAALNKVGEMLMSPNKYKRALGFTICSGFGGLIGMGIGLGSLYLASLLANPGILQRVITFIVNLHLTGAVLCAPHVMPSSVTSYLNTSWLIGLRVEGQKLISRYNCPLQNHSLVFELVFDKSTNETQLTIRFVGERRGRWDIIKKFAEMQSNFILPIKESAIGANEVTIVYNISTQKEIVQLEKTLNAMIFAANNAIDSQICEEIKALAMIDSDKFEKLASGNSEEAKTMVSAIITQFGTDKSKIKKWFESGKIKQFRTKLLKLFYEQNYKNATTEQRLEYYKKLVECGYDDNFGEASILAHNAVLSSDAKSTEKIHGLNILNMLVQKQYKAAYSQAFEAANSAISSDDLEIQLCCMNIYTSLINQKYIAAYPAAFEAAKKYSSNDVLKDSIYNMIDTLVRQGYAPAYEFAREFAVKFKMDYRYTRIVEILVEKGYEIVYAEALELAIEQGKQGYTTIFNTLVNKGYQPAFEAALNYLKSKTSYFYDEVQILKALLSQNYAPAFELAKEAAPKLASKSDRITLKAQIAWYKSKNAVKAAYAKVKQRICGK